MTIIREIKTDAFVKQNELDCFEWEHEDRLCVLVKLCDLVPEFNEYLFQVYNIDRDESNAVSTHQMIVIDESIFEMEPIMNDCDVISSINGIITGFEGETVEED